MNLPSNPGAASRRLRNLANSFACAVLAGALAAVPLPGFGQNAPPAPQIKVDQSALPRSTGAITSFAPVVDKIMPSVVTVFIKREYKDDKNSPANNPSLRRFFGLPDNSDPNGGNAPGGPNGGPNGDGNDDGSGGDNIEGLGSGVIVSADGLILTNNHVAEAGDDIMVRLSNGHEFTAKKVGNDPGTDIALLRIDAKDLPVITFADSDQLKVGDLVLAAGSPFGLTGSVTMGIVSALGRGGMGITDYENFIQTDASINPGNSGGALVDIQGRLVGINTAIYSRSGGNQGIGFAVPSNMALNIMNSLLKYGKVTRGYLGTVVQPLTPELAEAFKVSPDQNGALIADVNADGAAAEAGLKNGDIITAVNGKQIKDASDLRLTVASMMPGTKVTLTYLREGQSYQTDATLKHLPGANEEVAQNGDGPTQGKSNALDGITVGDLDNSSRQQLNAPADLQGVLVTDVSPDSVGYDAGLRKGDVILEMNHTALTSSDQAVDEGNKIDKDDHILLHVWTKGRSEYLVLKPKD